LVIIAIGASSSLVSSGEDQRQAPETKLLKLGVQTVLVLVRSLFRVFAVGDGVDEGRVLCVGDLVDERAQIVEEVKVGI